MGATELDTKSYAISSVDVTNTKSLSVIANEEIDFKPFSKI